MSPTLNRVQRLIVNEMPPHNLFLELFLGKKPLLQLKKPAPVNIGVDNDPTAAAAAAQRFQDAGFTIKLEDPIKFLPRHEWLHNQGRELIFCNLPRLGAGSRSESTVDYQSYLLELLKHLPCMVMIAGPWSDLYERALSGWRTICYKDADGLEEFVWMNFKQPFELHDYRFLGSNAHERDQLKRMADRWGERLDDMEPLKRYALLHAIRERSTRLGKED